MESKIKRRRLGKTNLQVTELSFGAMNLRKLNTVDEAYQILNYVLDQGINLIDTARAYNGENGQGVLVESEVLVGNTIRSRSDLREPIVVITKGHGYTLTELDKDLQTSRSKLGIEGHGSLKIGDNDVKLVYFFHGINNERWATMKQSGVLDRIQGLKEDGLISHIGFSSHYPNAEEIKAAVDTGIFEVVELPYNIFNRSLGEDGKLDLLEYLNKNDVGIINMKAFGGNGMPAIHHIVGDYISISYSAMLDFCLCNPYITTVDAGAKYIEEFRQDIETALKVRMTADEIQHLKAEADKVSADMQHVCRECMHCMEKFSCPHNVDFPQILSLYSRYRISEKMGKDTVPFSNQYQELSINGEDCAECGECLPWCEYKLNIPDMLKAAHQTFTTK